jgi:hypothetical protein
MTPFVPFSSNLLKKGKRKRRKLTEGISPKIKNQAVMVQVAPPVKLSSSQNVRRLKSNQRPNLTLLKGQVPLSNGREDDFKAPDKEPRRRTSKPILKQLTDVFKALLGPKRVPASEQKTSVPRTVLQAEGQLEIRNIRPSLGFLRRHNMSPKVLGKGKSWTGSFRFLLAHLCYYYSKVGKLKIHKGFEFTTCGPYYFRQVMKIAKSGVLASEHLKVIHGSSEEDYCQYMPSDDSSTLQNQF